MGDACLAPTPDTVAQMTEQVASQCRVDPALAMQTARQALELAEQLGDGVSRARALRAIGNACHVSDRNAEALDCYQQAATLFLQAADEIEAARTLSSQVMPLALLGRTEESLATADQAGRIFERYGEVSRIARLEINRGNIFHRLDRFAEALACYDRALAGLDPETDREAMAAVVSNRAVVLISLNRFSEALAAYEQARDFCERHNMAPLVAQADYNIAYLYFLRGEYTRAIGMLDRARLNFAALDNLYHLALCDLDQSELLLELNLHRDAERLADSARGQFDKLGLGYEAAKALANMAVAAEFCGNHTRALEQFDRARQLFAREKNEIWVHIVDLYRALVYLRMGRAYEVLRVASELHAYFASEGVISKAVYARLLLSRAHLTLEEHEPAESECRRAVEELQRLEAPWLSFHCYFQLACVQLSQGKREEARENYRLALRMLEAMRSHIHFDELKIAFVKDKLEAFQAFVMLSLDAAAEMEERNRHNGSSTPAAAQAYLEAFNAIEQAKSRSVGHLVSRASVPPPDTEAPSTILVRIGALREQLNWYYRKINLEEFQPRSDYHQNPGAVIRAIREHENELLRLFRQLPPEERYGMLHQDSPATVEEIQSALPADGQLLEYFLAEGVVVACLIDRHGLQFFPELSLTSRVERLLRLLRFQMSKMTLGDVLSPFAERMLRTSLAHLGELHRELIEPLQEKLTARHLVIVPHGILHYLPFHALYDGRQYLFERHAISYAPSATLFRKCVLRRPQSSPYSLVLEVGSGGMPGISQEVAQVRNLMPDARVFSAEAATSQCLRTLGANARFLHIASHGVFRHDNPIFSSIQLADGWMTLMDVYNLRLNCELVTLSGCGTGMNLVLAGDELVGLVRGFLFAGCASMLVSLWDVYDETTALLMEQFYRELRSGASKAESLQRAMQATCRRYPHPLYWAPFVLVGKPA